ncbi:MAG TPA: cation transporting ATPase C-terminal domain-containing protein, partial [Phototrophicaceae bacterium]|nr:cation transporting ATPase C-terminal domain-containing protein [Phototrophicaceae bacterium]
SVLKHGIVEGRTTFANTLKYVFMATSANFGNMFSMAGASLLLPFLPLLPKQILLVNFMTDLPELTIASDHVDLSQVQKPHRWDVAFIRRFMVIFGLLSSIFDYVTFGVLILLLGAGSTQFRTGWFTESLFSAVFVIFALRTRLPFMQSRSSRAMALVAFVVLLVVVLIPISPLANPLGFAPLAWWQVALMLVISAVYFGCAEVAKRWFYAQARNQ